MSTPTPYSCQCCGCDEEGGTYWAPSGVQLGRSMLAKMVCKSCCESTTAALNNEIWKDGHQQHTTRCNMCGCGFGPDGPYYAHRKPTVSGEWVLSPVCKKCFDPYKECCAKQK
jgi:hypothetical protein